MTPVTAQALEALEARWAEMDTYDDRPLLQQLMERGMIARHSPDPWPRMPIKTAEAVGRRRMNFLKPRQRQSDQRWDYTCANDNQKSCYAIGYCAPYRPWTDEQRERIGGYITDEMVAASEATAHKHHEDGHATPEEACECYKQYLLDHETHYEGHKQEPWSPCDICQKRTPNAVMVSGWTKAHLCDEHRNRECLEQVLKVGESMGS